MRRMSGRAWAVCEATPSKNEQPLTFVPRAPSRIFRPISCTGSGNIVPKSDYIANLERRQQTLEEELSKALLQYSSDDLLIADLKRRRLILRDELDRLQHPTAAGRSLH